MTDHNTEMTESEWLRFKHGLPDTMAGTSLCSPGSTCITSIGSMFISGAAAVLSSAAVHPDLRHLLLQAGDIESNPGPTLQDMWRNRKTEMWDGEKDNFGYISQTRSRWRWRNRSHRTHRQQQRNSPH